MIHNPVANFAQQSYILDWRILSLNVKPMEDSFVLTIFGGCAFYLQNWSYNRTDYGHMNAKFLILYGPNSNPNPK